MFIEDQKEASRRKSLGELGELFAIKTLVDKQYDKIRNINDDKMNEAYADIYCEKGNRRLVISVKTRNKFGKNGRLYSHYNLGNNAYEKAKRVSEKYNAEAYWMAIQFDTNDYSIYFGPLDCLDGANSIPVEKCEKGLVGTTLVYKKRHYFDFDYYKNK